MKAYKDLSKDELLKLKDELTQQYEDKKALGLRLNMARGKPAAAQLNLTMDMLDTVNSASDMLASDGTDSRNYGCLDGLPETKKLMADMMGTNPENVIVFGNASLTIMYDSVSRSYTHGVCGNTPWCKLDKVKWLCPVPGYDRHFAITEHFGIEMINIPMTQDGPDMDLVEKYVNNDESVKGIWCVPKYSNPQGVVYSDETVKRFANLKPAAKDFRIYWDNAYVIHHLYDDNQAELLDIVGECAKAGNPDMVYELRHVRYFKDINGLKAKMKAHAEIMRPKFEATLKVLEDELSGLEVGTWVKPYGGYFISFDAMEGCAKRIVSLCKEAGLVMTGAGATFPYGRDPKDSNIRIAPSFPTPDEMEQAADLFALCVKLASVEKLLETK